MPKKNEKNPVLKYAAAIIIGIIVYIIITFVFTALIVNTPYPKDNYMLFFIISMSVSSFICSFVFVFRERKNGMISGLIIGVVLSVIMFLFYSVFSSFNLSDSSLLIIPACLLPSAIAGVLAVNIKHK